MTLDQFHNAAMKIARKHCGDDLTYLSADVSQSYLPSGNGSRAYKIHTDSKAFGRIYTDTLNLKSPMAAVKALDLCFQQAKLLKEQPKGVSSI